MQSTTPLPFLFLFKKRLFLAQMPRLGNNGISSVKRTKAREAAHQHDQFVRQYAAVPSSSSSSLLLSMHQPHESLTPLRTLLGMEKVGIRQFDIKESAQAASLTSPSPYATPLKYHHYQPSLSSMVSSSSSEVSSFPMLPTATSTSSWQQHHQDDTTESKQARWHERQRIFASSGLPSAATHRRKSNSSLKNNSSHYDIDNNDTPIARQGMNIVSAVAPIALMASLGINTMDKTPSAATATVASSVNDSTILDNVSSPSEVTITRPSIPSLSSHPLTLTHVNGGDNPSSVSNVSMPIAPIASSPTSARSLLIVPSTPSLSTSNAHLSPAAARSPSSSGRHGMCQYSILHEMI
jgi:hypothetical protein